MKLVQCTECEGRVARTAPYCPHCGADRGNAILTVRRVYNGWGDFFAWWGAPLDVYIDGQFVEGLERPEHVEFPEIGTAVHYEPKFDQEITPGEHKIKVCKRGSWFTGDKELTVNLRPSEHLLVCCALKSGEILLWAE